MCVLQGGQSQQSVVCYDLYALAMWGVENVRKLLPWNKRSREKVFTLPASVVWLRTGTFPRGLGSRPSLIFAGLLALLVMADSSAPSP